MGLRRSGHRIVVDGPLDQAFMWFTPAGEELWVDGWAQAISARRELLLAAVIR